MEARLDADGNDLRDQAEGPRALYPGLQNESQTFATAVAGCVMYRDLHTVAFTSQSAHIFIVVLVGNTYRSGLQQGN
jgi:hypothetical protein